MDPSPQINGIDSFLNFSLAPIKFFGQIPAGQKPYYNPTTHEYNLLPTGESLPTFIPETQYFQRFCQVASRHIFGMVTESEAVQNQINADIKNLENVLTKFKQEYDAVSKKICDSNMLSKFERVSFKLSELIEDLQNADDGIWNLACTFAQTTKEYKKDRGNNYLIPKKKIESLGECANRCLISIQTVVNYQKDLNAKLAENHAADLKRIAAIRGASTKAFENGSTQTTKLKCEVQNEISNDLINRSSQSSVSSSNESDEDSFELILPPTSSVSVAAEVPKVALASVMPAMATPSTWVKLQKHLNEKAVNDAQYKLNILDYGNIQRLLDEVPMLHFAIQKNDSTLIKFLLEAGAEMSAVDATGLSAMKFAATMKRLSLIASSIDFSVAMQKSQFGLVNLFLSYKKVGEVESLFKENQIDINSCDSNGDTLLIFCCEDLCGTGTKDSSKVKSKLALINKLIECGAKLNHTNIWKKSALDALKEAERFPVGKFIKGDLAKLQTLATKEK